MKNLNMNDLWMYFEIIKQTEPESVVDFGPILKLTGCISRQALNEEIDSKIKLTGIDFNPDMKCPVYEKVYDRLVSFDDYEKENVSGELGIAFGFDDTTAKRIFDWCSVNCKFLLSDRKLPVSYDKEIITLSSETGTYYLYSFA